MTRGGGATAPHAPPPLPWVIMHYFVSMAAPLVRVHKISDHPGSAQQRARGTTILRMRGKASMHKQPYTGVSRRTRIYNTWQSESHALRKSIVLSTQFTVENTSSDGFFTKGNIGRRPFKKLYEYDIHRCIDYHLRITETSETAYILPREYIVCSLTQGWPS